MRWAYDNIKSTGLFDKDCERWRKRSYATKTWATFKAFFIGAEDDRKKNSPTADEATYSANQVQQILQDEIVSILAANQSLPSLTNTTTASSVSANATMTVQEVRAIVKDALQTNSN